MKTDKHDTDNAPAVQALARQRAKVKPNTPAQVACFDEAEAESTQARRIRLRCARRGDHRGGDARERRPEARRREVRR